MLKNTLHPIRMTTIVLCAYAALLGLAISRTTAIIVRRPYFAVLAGMHLIVQYFICMHAFVRADYHQSPPYSAFRNAFSSPHSIWERHTWHSLLACAIGGPHYLFLRGTIISAWHYALVALLVDRWFLFLFIALLRGYIYANRVLLLPFALSCVLMFHAVHVLLIRQSQVQPHRRAERATIENALNQLNRLIVLHELLRMQVDNL